MFKQIVMCMRGKLSILATVRVMPCDDYALALKLKRSKVHLRGSDRSKVEGLINKGSDPSKFGSEENRPPLICNVYQCVQVKKVLELA